MFRRMLVAVSGAFLLFAAGCGGGLELTAEHPLGTLQDISAMLPAGTFERSQRKFTEPECFNRERWEKFGELTVHQFEEHPGSSMGVHHWVLVGVDSGGEVQAIGAKFASRSAKFSDTGTRTEAFTAQLWQELSGGPAAFTKGNRPGIDLDEYLHAGFQVGGVQGYWEKTPNTKDVSHTRSIWDAVFIWRE